VRFVPPELPERAGVLILKPRDGAYRIAIDVSGTPDLEEWARADLAPVVDAWYPKIVDLLPSEGFEAPRELDITFLPDMRGVAATSGTRVRCAAAWFRSNLKGEAKGAVVHELVHVVQQYGGGRGGERRPPGWLVEGIPDYIRWFLYEPESRGAEITRRALPRARHDAGYRVSANFLHWAVRAHGAAIVPRLNAALRAGEYRDELWRELTGSALEDLAKAWMDGLKRSLDAQEADGSGEGGDTRAF